METVDKTTTITVTDKWFMFTKDEATVLADILMNKVDWEKHNHGENYEFLRVLYIQLANVRWES